MSRDTATTREGQFVLEVAGEVVCGLATGSGRAIRRAVHTPFDALRQRVGSPAGTLGAPASAGPRRKRGQRQSICISLAGTATRRAADSARPDPAHRFVRSRHRTNDDAGVDRRQRRPPAYRRGDRAGRAQADGPPQRGDRPRRGFARGLWRKLTLLQRDARRAREATGPRRPGDRGRRRLRARSRPVAVSGASRRCAAGRQTNGEGLARDWTRAQALRADDGSARDDRRPRKMGDHCRHQDLRRAPADPETGSLLACCGADRRADPGERRNRRRGALVVAGGGGASAAIRHADARDLRE